MPTFGSLFAGIGGIDLGLERAGWTCRWQVEWDAYCQAVLAKHWPEVRQYGDITTVDWSGVERVDLLAGGFPCQPVSAAGKRQAQADERWLWPEFLRAIRALRPRFVLVENVPGLLDRGMGDVIGDLAASGYDAEWDCIPAASFGAPHLRDRLWIIAHADADGHRSQAFAHEAFLRIPPTNEGDLRHLGSMGGAAEWLRPRPIGAGPMGVGNGVPNGLDRIKALGNAVVPQVVEVLGRQLLQAFEVEP